MKSILALSILFLTTSVFAAKIPSEKESLDIINMIKKGQSIAPIIKSIRSNKLDPFYGFNLGPISTPGNSYLAAAILSVRMSLNNPVGSEAENVELLRIIIDKGLSVNQKQSDGDWFMNNTLLDLASRECNTSAVDLLLSNGADPKREDFYWTNSLYKSFNYELNSPNDMKCASMVLKFLDTTDKISLETAYKFLSGRFDMVDNPLLKGAMLDIDLKPEIKEKLAEKFDVNPSPRPITEEPSGDWFSVFKKHLGQPGSSSDRPGPDNYKNWWPQYSENEKAWACYYSSFDELYPLLLKIGLSEDQIMHQPLTSAYASAFGEFAVKIFVPFCNSLRN